MDPSYSEDEGIIKAIRIHTKRNLHNEQFLLRDEGLEAVIDRAREHEGHILQKLFYFLNQTTWSGVVRILLSEDGKKAIEPIKDDILFLLRYHLWAWTYREIEERLKNPWNEPFRIIIEYTHESTHLKQIYIKKIRLEPIDG